MQVNLSSTNLYVSMTFTSKNDVSAMESGVYTIYNAKYYGGRKSAGGK